MNKLEETIVTGAVESIFAGSVRKDSAESLAEYNLRMKTSVENGCHTLIKLVESNEANKQVILNTLLFLEELGAIDENYTISEILGVIEEEELIKGRK